MVNLYDYNRISSFAFEVGLRDWSETFKVSEDGEDGRSRRVKVGSLCPPRKVKHSSIGSERIPGPSPIYDFEVIMFQLSINYQFYSHFYIHFINTLSGINRTWSLNTCFIRQFFRVTSMEGHVVT